MWLHGFIRTVKTQEDTKHIIGSLVVTGVRTETLKSPSRSQTAGKILALQASETMVWWGLGVLVLFNRV